MTTPPAKCPCPACTEAPCDCRFFRAGQIIDVSPGGGNRGPGSFCFYHMVETTGLIPEELLR